jgi:hypothetical protein
MRKEKILINLLSGIVDLLAEESARNPEFANKIEVLLCRIVERKPTEKKKLAAPMQEPLPDIHAECNKRGEPEFRLWLRDQPIAVLRAVIRTQDFDPTRRTAKWRDPEKLADFIADSLRARLARGSAFIGKAGEERKKL